MTYFKTGEFYSGDWERGLRHGRGRLKYLPQSDKDYYDGSWQQDKATGKGVIVKCGCYKAFSYHKGFVEIS
jgi:hypothetical protein